MEKLDLKKTLKPYYTAKAQPSLVNMPRLHYLMIDGRGNPNTTPEYQEALQALYGVAYTLKFHVKKTMEMDFGVMGLEGLWWAENMAEFSVERKDDWLWTMMIVQPDFITSEMVDEAKWDSLRKKGLTAIERVRFERYDEGLSAQIMHFGPYADEAPTIERLHAFIHENGFSLTSKHHEIYLSDPRRSAPDKMKTIIRQPVRKLATHQEPLS